MSDEPAPRMPVCVTRRTRQVMSGSGVRWRVAGRSVDLGAGGSYGTRGYALVIEPANWRTELFGMADTVRFRAASADGVTPLFVGVAKPGAVERVPDRRAHTTVHRNTGQGNTRTHHEGKRPRSPSQSRALDRASQPVTSLTPDPGHSPLVQRGAAFR